MQKWIELIRVRSSEPTLLDALPSLEDEVSSLSDELEHADVSILRHALYDGDLAIVLVWRTGDSPKKSLEGLRVAARLERLGSIDHAVWLPFGT